MKKLTVLFYENPVALSDIENWKKMQQHKILYYEHIDNEIKFHLQTEVIICTPINTPNISLLRVFCKNYTYSKSVIIGQVTSDDLTRISKLINDFKNW